ncbi:MAG: EpsG family protein [Bacteroidia bacterium]|nr:EpsG family protein [Bacteroidia bacterium]
MYSEIYDTALMTVLVSSSIWFFFFRDSNRIGFLNFVVVFLTLGLLLALRDYRYVGIDMIRYSLTYEQTADSTFEESFNIREGANFGYFILNYILAKSGIPFQSFVIWSSIFIVFSTIWVYYKNDALNPFSIAAFMGLGVYTFDFSGMKQGLAMAVLMWCYYLLQKNHDKLSYILFFVALSIHPIAIIFAPYFFINKVLITQKHIVLLLIAFGIVFAFRVQIGLFLTLMFADNYVDRYESSGNVGGTFLLFLSLYVLYVFLFKKDIFEAESHSKDLFLILTIMVFVQMLSSFAYTFTRANLCLVQLIPLAIAEMLDNSTNRKFMVLSYMIVFAFYSIKLYHIHLIGEFIDVYESICNFDYLKQ